MFVILHFFLATGAFLGYNGVRQGGKPPMSKNALHPGWPERQQEVIKLKSKTKSIVGIGLFTAIVVVLQLLGTPLKLGMFAGAVALLPIVVGAGLYGWKAGAWLGFAFGATVLLSGDAAPFMAISIPGTIITVLSKGCGCGTVAGLVHKLLQRYNKTVAAYVAAIVAPVVNTGIFALGCYVFFYQALAGWNAESVAPFANTTAYIFLGLIGTNFFVEVGTSVVLAPVITRLIKMGNKQ